MDFIQYYKKAQKEKWAIGQFNISNMDILKGVLKAALKLKSPIIIGTSEGESEFLGLQEAVDLIDFYRRKTGLPILLNLDHGHSFEYIKEAIDTGYLAIHFDGSQMTLKNNIETAKKIKDYADKKGVLVVEGEIDAVSGSSRILKKIPNLEKLKLTDPKEARYFIDATNIDSLAINIGTFHGQVLGVTSKLDMERLKNIKDEIKDTFLVLHGGSGVSDKDFKKAISLGITKININTELRIAFTDALKKGLSVGETTPYKYLPKAIEAVSKTVEKKIKVFGSFGKI